MEFKDRANASRPVGRKGMQMSSVVRFFKKFCSSERAKCAVFET